MGMHGVADKIAKVNAIDIGAKSILVWAIWDTSWEEEEKESV